MIVQHLHSGWRGQLALSVPPTVIQVSPLLFEGCKASEWHGFSIMAFCQSRNVTCQVERYQCTGSISIALISHVRTLCCSESIHPSLSLFLLLLLLLLLLHDFKETSVEPYTKLLDSPPLFSDKVSSADPDYDDTALEDMLHQAHRAHHSPREDLSVSLSSSMSDRTGRPVGDRTWRPVEHRNQEAQIRTLLDKQKEQILAECQARINKHEFQAAYDRRSLLKLGENVDSQQELHCAPKKFNNEINRFKDNYCIKIWNYVKLIREVSLKWKS